MTTKTTLEDVYKVFKKYLYLEDTNRIDIFLATILSNQLEGTPIWMFFVGKSGDTKSEIIKSAINIKNVRVIDQITANTLATGKKGAVDLGSQLTGKSTILLFPDLASLTGLHKDEKKRIWSQFRTLYDGDIYKQAGSGIKEKAYTNCHVTVIAGTTNIIKNEYHINQQLGTRELMYYVSDDKTIDNLIMEKSWDNEGYEKHMRAMLQEIISKFIEAHKITKIEPTEEIKSFCKKEANRLKILRATAQIDCRTYEPLNNVDSERPARLIKQLKRIYIALKSLDDNYPDEKAKKIISHIIDSSGDETRDKLIKILKKENRMMKIPELQESLKISRNKVMTELNILYNLGLVKRIVENERIGGITVNENGYEKIIGGKWENVYYFKWI